MEEERLIVPADDDTFAVCTEAARLLWAACLEQSARKPHPDGEKGHQVTAFHFLISASLNASELPAETAMHALACGVGCAVAEFEDPELVLEEVGDAAAAYLQAALERQAVTYGEPVGNA